MEQVFVTICFSVSPPQPRFLFTRSLKCYSPLVQQSPLGLPLLWPSPDCSIHLLTSPVPTSLISPAVPDLPAHLLTCFDFPHQPCRYTTHPLQLTPCLIVEVAKCLMPLLSSCLSEPVSACLTCRLTLLFKHLSEANMRIHINYINQKISGYLPNISLFSIKFTHLLLSFHCSSTRRHSRETQKMTNWNVSTWLIASVKLWNTFTHRMRTGFCTHWKRIRKGFLYFFGKMSISWHRHRKRMYGFIA